MRKLVVTDRARGDLQDISQYTERQWGSDRRRRYMGAIADCLARLLRNPSLGAPRDDIRPGCRSVVAGRHVVFYQQTNDRIAIIRILHERMDLHRHLSEE